MNETPIWLTEAEVASVIDMPSAMAALERGFAYEAAGSARNMVKTHALWGNEGSTLHAIGAVFEEAKFACTKTWVNTPRGSSPMLLLFDAHDGTLKAVIEAMVLGQFRTGGVTGVATKWMAPSGPCELALIGTGKQAMTQLAAVSAARQLKTVRVWGRNVDKRDGFIKKASETFGIHVTSAASIAEACDGAQIVTVVTRATSPLISEEMLARGAHFNAVGAITPERMEFEPSLLRRASSVVVDSVEQVRKLSREFMDYFGGDDSAWSNVKSLAHVIGAERRGDSDLSVFKAMGVGIADLSLATEIYTRATAHGLGLAMPTRAKVEPKLTTKMN